MKRRVLKLGVFLLQGAIINVAVAWAASVSAQFHFDDATVSESKEHNWSLVSDPEIAALFLYSVKCSKSLDHRAPVAFETTAPSPQQMAPTWTGLTPDEPFGCESRHLFAYGWPALTLWCEYDVGKQDVDVVSTCKILDGIDIGSSRPLRILPIGALVPRALPKRPIPLGFAINTIFYAAILWLLWIAPGRNCRFIRVKRHRCPACGYQIDSAPGIGPVCSECGAALPAAWSTSPS